MKLTRAATLERDQRLYQLHLEGKPPAEIAEALGFKNAQVVRVKICKINRGLNAAHSLPDDALSVVTTPAE